MSIKTKKSTATEARRVKGSELTAAQQREVLAAYVHRFTGNHVPQWARKPMDNGNPYPVQFKDDQEWLENTTFAVTSRGQLDSRSTDCHCSPTWPHNPELRKGNQ